MFEIEISSLNSARKIDELIRRKIRVKRVRREGKLLMWVKGRDLRAVKAVFPDATSRPVGINALVKVLAKKGVVIGTALGIILTGIFSQFTFGVRISGADRLRSEISAFFVRQGYDAIRLKSGTDCDGLEKDLLSNFELSIADVSVSGGYIDVLVKEELPAPSIVDLRKVSPLIASHDGVVTRVVVTAGTAVVQKGMAVQQGQVLIDNKRLIGEESVGVRAEGEVYARVPLVARATVGKTATRWVRSGRTYSAQWTDVCGLYSKVSPPFDRFEVVERRVRTGDVLPIYAVYATFYELTPSEVPTDWERDVERVKEELHAELQDSLPEGAVEQNFFCTLREISGRIEVCAVMETEIIISVRPSKNN